MKRKILFLLVSGILLSGCATKMSPMPEPLSTESVQGWKISDYKRLSKKIIAMDKHTQLQQYIVQVLGNNPDLKSLSATAKAASYNIKIANTENRPRTDLNLTGSRNKDAEIGNSVSLGMDISWMLDPWGKLADDAEAARHLADRAHHDLQQLKRVLIIQAAQLWVEYRSYTNAEKYLIDLNEIQAGLVGYYQDAYQAGLMPFSYYRGDFQVGLVSYEFFLDAKNSQKRSQLRLRKIQLEKLLVLQLMNTLRGRPPADELSVSDDFIPVDLALFSSDIPATVLANRPDIQAAFAEVLAFRRLESSAYKALLPQINLTASASKSGATLEKALRGDLLWQLIGGLTQPLFNSGQIKIIAKQKSAESEALWWRYQNMLLKAMLEVENALASGKLLGWLLDQKQAELSDLERKLSSAKERFADGDLSLADYLLIKTERIESLIELSDSESRYLKNRLDLVMALGLPLEIQTGGEQEENSHEES